MKIRRVIRVRCLALSAKARNVENAVRDVSLSLKEIAIKLASPTCPRDILQNRYDCGKLHKGSTATNSVSGINAINSIFAYLYTRELVKGSTDNIWSVANSLGRT